MSQTIICEYLAKWEETGIAPETTEFGFDGGIYGMLVECQDVMLKLGTAANDGKRRIAQLEQQIADDASVNAEIDKRLKAHDDAVTTKDEIIDELKEQVKAQDSTIKQLVNIIQSRVNRIAELESQVAALTEQLAESDEVNESLDRQLADTQKAVNRLLIEQELDAMEQPL